MELPILFADYAPFCKVQNRSIAAIECSPSNRILTTEANNIVAPIHPKAIPVILTTPEEFDLWLDGETVEALKLQRPLPDEMLRIVARGGKEDAAPTSWALK